MQNDDDTQADAPDPSEGGGEVLAFPGFSEESPDDVAPDDEDMASEEPEGDETAFDDFTHEDYVQSTTREYKGLADAVAKAAGEDTEQQAIAASMPGVQTGVVGFEDMTGEDVENAAEVLHEEERAERSDLMVRVGTALALLALFLGALLAGGGWIASFLAIVIILALGEFYASVRRAGFVPVALFGLLGTVCLLAGTWAAGPFAIGGVLAATLVAVTLWFALVPRRNALANASITVMGVAWISALMAFAFPIFQAGDSFMLVIVLVLLTAVLDIASYFTGRTMGRRQLAPVVSPNKTIEGLIGGMVAAIALGGGIGASGLAEPFTLGSGLLLGAAVAVFAPLGDLVESVVKRLLGVKDMGSILPGHGGILDRVDGFIFTIPAAYFVYLWYQFL